MPKKAKLPESTGAQPKTITQDTFTSQDICYRDATYLPPTHPTKPRHPQGVTWSADGSPQMGKMACGLLLGPHQWCCPSMGYQIARCWPSSLLGTVSGDGSHVGSQQRLDKGQLWYTAHYYLNLFAWCGGIWNQIPSNDRVVENCPLKPYLAMAYAKRLQVVACQSLRLDANTLACSVEAFLEAMSGACTLPRDRILHFLESDACTKLLEMQGPLKDMFLAFWDLFRMPDEDPLAGILMMHKVQTEYKATICLHDLPMGMMSRKG